MDFFNSLSQIAKNKDNFKKWEKEQRNEQAQREELYNRRQYSDEEIARAKALGENIIDVIDIMDNHSESVAENVETATEPMIAAAPFIGLGLSGWGAYKIIFKPNDKKLSKAYDDIIRSPEANDLCERISNYKRNKKVHNSSFGNYQLKSKKQIEKIEDAQLREEALKIYQKYQKVVKPIKRSNKLGILGMVATAIASFIGINIYAAKLQVDSSKIARYQARESLKDPKAFVTYTPEQIAKAKEEIAKHPEWLKEKKKEKLKTGMFKSIINLFKDRKAYLNSVKNDTDESKIVSRELTPEEIEQAKRDQEIIQRSVRIINNEAEKYSQNMEVASEVLINGTPFLGAAIGGALGWILNKLGVIDKIISHSVEKNASDKTKTLYKDLKRGKESGKSILAKWGNFAKSFIDDLKLQESKIDTAGMTKQELKQAKREASARPKDIVKYMKRLSTVAFAHPVGKNWIIGGIGAIITGIAGALIGLKLQKSASRAGRYTAKRELEKDPRNFIGYTEADYNEVKDVKNSKPKVSKIKEVITFLPTTVKQYFEYEKFRNKEYKENKLLQEQLMKQEVTEEQLREAKNLQRKLFNTFEKVDDNSQMYSESMEAAIDIAQPFVMYGSIIAALSPIFIGSYLMYKGKLSPAKVINKFVGFMSKSTDRLQSKWFKKYLTNVSKNVSTKVQNTQVSSKPIGSLTSGIDVKNDSISQIFSKLWSNFKVQVKGLANMDNDKQIKELFKIKIRICKIVAQKDTKLGGKLEKIFDNIMYYAESPQVRADALTIFMQPFAIKEMTPERYQKAYELLETITKDAVLDTKLSASWKELEKAKKELTTQLRELVKDNIDTTKIRGLIDKIEEIPELKGVINRKEVESILKALEDFKPAEVNVDELKRITDEFERNSGNQLDVWNLRRLIQHIENEEYYSLRSYIEYLEDLKGKNIASDDTIDGLIHSIINLQKQNERFSKDAPEILNYENVVRAINQMEQLKAKIKEIPELLKRPEIQEFISKYNESQQIPIFNKGMYDTLLQRGLIKEGQKTIPLTEAIKLFKEKQATYTSMKIRDLLKHQSPKDVLSKIKETVNGMSDEEFLNKMESMNIAGLRMDKKTMLEIITKIEKMIDNVPKEEMQQIMDAILKEMTEHPDEFIKFISEGNPTSIFMTPGLKIALATAGISWATFMLVIKYAIESWLADIKLKSGRLGVMKAMEGLQDPKYYANIEPTQTPATKTTTKTDSIEKQKVQESNETSTTGNLLDKYKK